MTSHFLKNLFVTMWWLMMIPITKGGTYRGVRFEKLVNTNANEHRIGNLYSIKLQPTCLKEVDRRLHEERFLQPRFLLRLQQPLRRWGLRQRPEERVARVAAKTKAEKGGSPFAEFRVIRGQLFHLFSILKTDLKKDLSYWCNFVSYYVAIWPN